MNNESTSMQDVWNAAGVFLAIGGPFDGLGVTQEEVAGEDYHLFRSISPNQLAILVHGSALEIVSLPTPKAETVYRC